MTLLEKICIWICPQLKKYYRAHCEELDGLHSEIEANRTYINLLEKRDKEMADEIKELRSQLYSPIVTEKSNPIIKIRSQEGWQMMDDLPNKSIPELIVTDGEIVQTVQWDSHNKQFLKCFGAQAMYVSKPVAWMPMPLPPVKHNGYLSAPFKSVASQLSQTYIR